MDPTGTVDAPARPSPSRNGLALSALVAAVLAVVASATLAWQGWRARSDEAAADARQADALAALERRIEALSAEATALVQRTQALERRLADAEGVGRSVREEVLGLGERARLIEDAVARLADRRLSGAVQLRLNEAEFLLRMGAERLALFGDGAGAVQAFRLADAELAALDDPVYAGIRQAIAAEIAALQAVPAVDLPGTLRALDQLADRILTWPTRSELARAQHPSTSEPSAWYARALALLGQFVRIRRIEADTEAGLTALDAGAARAALAIEFATAKSAALAGDAEAYRAALERVRRLVDSAFAESDPELGPSLAQLTTLAEAAVAPRWPEVGQALMQLRNLRATRALGPEPSP